MSVTPLTLAGLRASGRDTGGFSAASRGAETVQIMWSVDGELDMTYTSSKAEPSGAVGA